MVRVTVLGGSNTFKFNVPTQVLICTKVLINYQSAQRNFVLRKIHILSDLMNEINVEMLMIKVILPNDHIALTMMMTASASFLLSSGLCMLCHVYDYDKNGSHIKS